MKIGIVVTIHNRPYLTRQTLESLRQSGIPAGSMLILIDDNSDIATQEMIDEFTINNIMVLKTRRTINPGIKKSLMIGCEWCFDHGCDVVTNLDNDVKLKRDWLKKLLELHQKFPHRILTGFHSTTKNADGTERHEIIQQGPDWATKRSVGGINMFFEASSYYTFIKPALEKEIGNWDHMASISALSAHIPIISTVPSVIQHTGIYESSMGHISDRPDIAADYYEKELPDVTLFGLDTVNYPELVKAAEICQMDIKFGHVDLLRSGVNSKQEYSEFIIKHLHTRFVTSHVLIIQSDGYIINPNAWRDEWLEYDYIGATWLYKDGMNVGNGGFSLRSHQLMQYLSQDLRLTNFHPEDHVICRELRPALECAGFKFATEEVANKFSIEAYGTEKLEGANKYSGQFGFHGWSVDFSDWPNAPQRPKRYDAHKKRWL